MKADLIVRFSYHSVSPKTQTTMGILREKMFEVASLIDDVLDSSREKSLAITNLEQALFWANAGISRENRGHED